MFCKNLKFYRKQSDVSQKALAHALGVSQQAIAKWEQGTSSPNPEMIAKISEILSVPTENLLQPNNAKESRLTRLRIAAGYSTQQELANALKVNQTAVSQWERGATSPSAVMLIKLSDLYGVSTDYLLGRENKAETIIEKLDELSISELTEIISKAAKLIKDKQ